MPPRLLAGYPERQALNARSFKQPSYGRRVFATTYRTAGVPLSGVGGGGRTATDSPNRLSTRHTVCNHMGYTSSVAITGFRHKGLQRFFATGARSGIQAKHSGRLRLILGRLNVATSAQDMDLPGLDLHELRGPRKGTWAVKVSGNWRVTFTCAERDMDEVDYQDYH